MTSHCRRRRRNRELAEKRHARRVRRLSRRWTADGLVVLSDADGWQLWGKPDGRALVQSPGPDRSPTSNTPIVYWQP